MVAALHLNTSFSRRAQALFAIAAASAVAAGLVAHFGSTTHPVATAAKALAPVALSSSQLASHVKTLGQPVFWLGPKPGFSYELRRTNSGQVYVRYLPAGATAGSTTLYLTVGTYPLAGAYRALRHLVATGAAADAAAVQGGGIAVTEPGRLSSVHVAYPGIPYEIEVYDPANHAAALVAGAGGVVSVTAPVAGGTGSG